MAERTPRREEDTEAHATDEELGCQSSEHSSEADEQTEREEDSQTEDEDNSQAEKASKTVNMDEDNEVIEQFSSSKPDTDPLLPQRKQRGKSRGAC